MFTYEDIFSHKQRFLFVTAHPDDLVVFFGALVHRLVNEGKDVYTLLVTSGDRGSRGSVISESELGAERLSEEKECLRLLGVPDTNQFSLGYEDGQVESNLQLIGDIVKYIRKYKVDLVATHEPTLQYLSTYSNDGFFVQHRDHRHIGEATIDAVYPYSRDRSFFTEHYVEGIEPHEVFDILLTDEKECNFNFDYTDIVELKKAAMRAHTSQFNEETVEEIINLFKLEGKYLERFNYLKLLW